MLVYDIVYLNDVRDLMSNCDLNEDKGYLIDEVQVDLFQSSYIKLQVPMRKNQSNDKMLARYTYKWNPGYFLIAESANIAASVNMARLLLGRLLITVAVPL